MLGSYVTSAIRALQRDPWHATVNILGLAVALAAGLLIALYVRHELSYENFITEPERVYRVESQYISPGRPVLQGIGSPYPVADLLNAELGEQVTATRLAPSFVVIETDLGKSRRSIRVGDEHLFEVLDLPVVAGDGAAAMAEPGALLLSRRTARELFGVDAAPSEFLGRTVRVNGADLHVAAVLEDPPLNTDRPVDILGSVATPAIAFPDWQQTEWGVPVGETFVRLKGATPSEAVGLGLPGIVERHSNYRFDLNLLLRPLRMAHLATVPNSIVVSNRNVIAIGALAATGAFLIFIACFSYINLATARSLLRLKEVGLRKIMGGRSSQLAIQFLSESALVTLIAFLLAVIAAAAALPVFGNLVGRSFSLADLGQPGFLASAAGLLAFVALAAGAYPALALACRKPVDLVREKKQGGGKLLRTGIVSLQFGLTSALMIAATIAFAQLAYLRNLDLGFDRSGLLVIGITPDQAADGRGQVLLDRLAAGSSFTAATVSSGAPGGNYSSGMSLSRPGDSSGTLQSVFELLVDPQFFDVYGLAPLAGRLLSDDLGVDQMNFPTPEQPSTRTNAVLTAAAVRLLGFASPQEAVGQEVSWAPDDRRIDFTIVGVVPDIQFRLGRSEHSPMMFLPPGIGGAVGGGGGGAGEITARVRPGAEASALAEAQEIWSQIVPDERLRYQFMEDRIALANADDDRQSKLFGFFAGLALFVACLGLFALASFVAARRTFEVAMRKVLGASTLGVTRLLMWDFAKPVLLANAIAWPLAYVMVSPWLQRFPYRIELSPSYFLGVSALSLSVAMITVLLRTWKTARTAPALVLRTE